MLKNTQAMTQPLSEGGRQAHTTVSENPSMSLFVLKLVHKCWVNRFFFIKQLEPRLMSLEPGLFSSQGSDLFFGMSVNKDRCRNYMYRAQTY